MRNLLSTLLVFSFLFTIGCEDDEATDDATESNPLVGVYNMVSYSVSGNFMESVNVDADANNSLVMILADSVCSIQGTLDGESNSESGTWSSNGDTLTIIILNEDWYTVPAQWYYVLLRYLDLYTPYHSYWTYTLSGDDMSMSLTDNYDESLTITYNWDKE